MNKVRMIIDILMTMLLPVLMAYSLVGEQAHEILGVLMFGFFVVHHVINRKWWTGLFRGKYNAVRILSTAVNIFLAVFMIYPEECDNRRNRFCYEDDPYDTCILGIYHDKLSHWPSRKNDGGKSSPQNENCSEERRDLFIHHRCCLWGICIRPSWYWELSFDEDSVCFL